MTPVADLVHALCRALGYAPDDVAHLDIDPEEVTVTYIVRDLNGDIECDAVIGLPIEFDETHPWTRE